MEEKSRSSKSASRILGACLIVLGILLVICSLALVFHNQQESQTAGEEAKEDLPKVVEVIEKARETPREEVHVNPYDILEVEKAQAMTETKINGYPYIGYLTIPKFDLELPVMTSPTDRRLQIAPCRHMGSTKTNDIVIAAHNYPTHFGKLKDLNQGDVIYFTDMDGVLGLYTVDTVSIISPWDIDLVENSGYDMVLYTCTYGGSRRVMVGCYLETA